MLQRGCIAGSLNTVTRWRSLLLLSFGGALMFLLDHVAKPNSMPDVQRKKTQQLKAAELARRAYPLRAACSGRDSEAGFSLLEVLAALVVTLLLMLALMPFVQQTLATWSRGSEVAGIVEFRSRGLGLLRRDLRHAVVWRGFGRMEDLLTFRGSETSMSFLAASEFGDSRLEMITIDVSNRSEGRALVRRRAPVIGTARSGFTDPVILLSGTYKYYMRYYSVDGVEASVWNDPFNLPARVVLSIADDRGGLPIVSVQLPLLASISAACLATSKLPNCPVNPRIDAASLASGFGQVTQE
jgi:hypothetical protein